MIQCFVSIAKDRRGIDKFLKHHLSVAYLRPKSAEIKHGYFKVFALTLAMELVLYWRNSYRVGAWAAQKVSHPLLFGGVQTVPTEPQSWRRRGSL